MSKNVSIVLDSAKAHTGSRKIKDTYKPFKPLDNRITPEDRAKTKKIFEVAQAELGGTIFDVNILTRDLLKVAAESLGEIHFDPDKSTKPILLVVEESGIRFGISKFLETVF